MPARTALESISALKGESGSQGLAVPSPNHSHDACCGHLVQFYETDAFLAELVSSYIGEGIEAGEAAIVIGTPEHRRAMESRLSERGVDLAMAKARGEIVCLDPKARSLEAEIEDRKRIEQILRESEARLSAILDERARADKGLRHLATIVESDGISGSRFWIQLPAAPEV